MNRISQGILKYKKTVVALFLILAAVSAIMSMGVGVNYKLVDYLP